MSYNRSRSESPCGYEPVFKGYQLIGDSQFLRFSEKLLYQQRKKKNGLAYLGLCVSGQKVGELLRRVHDHFGEVSSRVVLLIGTNDLLRGTSFEAMRDDLRSLLRLLRSRGADKIILLTLPPVPRLKASGDHWNRLKKYNEFIVDSHDGKHTIVADAYAKFVIAKKTPTKRSAPSCSIFANGCGTAELPSSICNLKEGTIRVSIGERTACRQVYYKGDHTDDENDDDGEESSPLQQRRLPSRSPLLQPRRGGGGLFARHELSGQARGVRRARSPDSEDEDCEPPTAKRRRSPSGDSGIDSSRSRSRASVTSNSSRSSSFAGDDYYSSPDVSFVSRKARDSHSRADDDHDDGYGRSSLRAEDEAALKNADEIRLDCFEKVFAGRGNREDLIHFNYEGLNLIKRLIEDTIGK